jgi:hypothetical protein
MSSHPLFDRMFEPGELARPVSIGSVLKEIGIESALEKAERIKSDYIRKCISAIESFPKGAMITSEDIREIAGPPPSDIDRSVLAGIMRSAAGRKHGLIVITSETRPGKRASLHHKDLSLWRRI